MASRGANGGCSHCWPRTARCRRRSWRSAPTWSGLAPRATSRRLSGRALIRRRVDPQDGRRAEVELTAAGQTLYDELFPQSVGFNCLVLAALSPGELAGFEVALAKLAEAAERIAGAKPVAEKADRRHGGARRLRAG